MYLEHVCKITSQHINIEQTPFGSMNVIVASVLRLRAGRYARVLDNTVFLMYIFSWSCVVFQPSLCKCVRRRSSNIYSHCRSAHVSIKGAMPVTTPVKRVKTRTLRAPIGFSCILSQSFRISLKSSTRSSLFFSRACHC